MASDKDMQDKLARLAQTDESFVDGARLLAGDTADDRLRALIDEIDDTVLASDLTVLLGDHQLVLSVSGRRLHGVRSASDGLPAAAGLAETPLDANDTEMMATLAQSLGELAQGDGAYRLRTSANAKLGGGTDMGVTTVQLRALVLNEAPLPDGTPVTQLLGLCRDQITGFVTLTDGKIDQSGGNKAIVAQLKGFAQDNFPEFDRKRSAANPGQNDPSLTSLLDVIDSETSVSVAVNGKEIALFLHNINDLSHISASWSRVSG